MILLLLLLASLTAADYLNSGAEDANGHPLPDYSPGRPPSIPLAVRSPYLSAWITTAGNTTLNSASATFWSGSPLGWDGLSLQRISGVEPARPLSVAYDAHYSNFTFAAGAVEITASFFSPVTPLDVCRTSIPLSYPTTSVRVVDNKTHAVRLYSDVNDAWIRRQRNSPLLWDLVQDANANSSSAMPSTWVLQQSVHYPLAEDDDMPQWGNFTYSTSNFGSNLTFANGDPVAVRYGFVANRALYSTVQSDSGFAGRESVFAFAHDFGLISGEATVRYTIGSIQAPAARYLYSGGVAQLRPWWTRCYGDDLMSLVRFHWNDFAAVSRLAASFSATLTKDISDYYGNETQTTNTSTFNPDTVYGFLSTDNTTSVGVPGVSEADSLFAIVALSARQVMGAYIYAVPPANSSEPLMFQKEVSSDGNVNTIDVIYPASPFFLYANPDMLKYLLQPVFEQHEAGFYPNSYSAHDIGAQFPNATGHVDGNDEYMPVEESGDVVLLAYAYYRFSGDAAWLASHYALLRQFAAYLVDHSLVPAAQLSTDDFAGTLANQTNLAIKGILGIQAMARIAEVAGHPDDAAQFETTAANYYKQWLFYAIDPSKSHTLLAYQWRSSWGLLYNIYMDTLLNLKVVDDSVYAMQSRWYAQVAQVFGVPLDSRHHYTKSDWMMWAAAASTPGTRRLLVTSLAYWLNCTATEQPFADLFETVGAGYYPQVPQDIRFKARPVVGGHFAILALIRSKHGQSVSSGTPASGSHAPAPTTVVVSSGTATGTVTEATATARTASTVS